MSWSVVRCDEDSYPLEVIGAFSTQKEAEDYALKSIWRGKKPLKGSGVSMYNYVAVPWTCRDKRGYDVHNC